MYLISGFVNIGPFPNAPGTRNPAALEPAPSWGPQLTLDTM